MTTEIEKTFFDTFGIEPDVQTINITIDDLINGNLRDMEITAQFGVYRQAVKGLAEQLKAKEQECDVLRKLAETHLAETINMQRELDQLTEELAISIQENEEGREINAELKAKNEQLKKEIRLYDCIDKWGTEQCRCACRCLGNEFCDDADKKINKLKQALRDIIEIAKPQTHYINIKQNKTASEVEYDYANIVWNLEQRMYKILQKCEVLDE